MSALGRGSFAPSDSELFSAVVMLRWIALVWVIFVFSTGCGESAGRPGGFGGEPGTGGVDISPDAGLSCVLTGCVDGNECTIDGMCEPLSGVCVGAGPVEPYTPCGEGELFICDGQGECVACIEDSQCEAFFPDEECRVAPTCVAGRCPLPQALPDRTSCSIGECRDGMCLSPWAPKQLQVPMACGSSFSAELFESPMELTVAPTPIEPNDSFSAVLNATIHVPRSLMQLAVIASYPAPLTTLELSGARAEVSTTGVTTGSPVATTLVPLPQQIDIPQAPNVGDPGGSACVAPSDCPLSDFGQLCVLGLGTCLCACQPGCVPSECANVVTGDALLEMEPIQGAIYDADDQGDVCFDASGDALEPKVEARIRTGFRVSSFPGPFAIECEGGRVNRNGTLGNPEDDVVEPNPAEAQACFPIGF